MFLHLWPRYRFGFLPVFTEEFKDTLTAIQCKRRQFKKDTAKRKNENLRGYSDAGGLWGGVKKRKNFRILWNCALSAPIPKGQAVFC